MTPGVLAVARREARRALGSAYYPVFFLLLPIASFALLIAIFGDGVPRDLPVVVVDRDHSALSRRLTRMVDATPSMRVAFQATDLGEARRLVLEGRAYAIVDIPANMERDVRRNEAPRVNGYYNAQYQLPGSLIRRDMRGAIATLSAGLEIKVRESRGEPELAAMAHMEPIRLDSHTLFNPQLNYAYFLVTALLPTMLQIFITVGTIHVLAGELKDGTAGAWMDAAGQRAWRAVAGKLLPYTLHFTALALLMVAILFRWMGVPLQGQLQLVVVGTVLFVLAYQSVGLVLAAWIANARMATSTAAFYTTPAFAFVGVTFPTLAMPALGRLWGDILPLTHYLRLLTDQGLRGAPAAAALPTLGVLLAFAVVGPLVSIARMGHVARDERYWGRL